MRHCGDHASDKRFYDRFYYFWFCFELIDRAQKVNDIADKSSSKCDIDAPLEMYKKWYVWFHIHHIKLKYFPFNLLSIVLSNYQIFTKHHSHALASSFNIYSYLFSSDFNFKQKKFIECIHLITPFYRIKFKLN